MRRRWTGGSRNKVKLAKRDKAAKQLEYFEKKKQDADILKPRQINSAVFDEFLAADPTKDRMEAYLSKDYLLLTSKAPPHQKPSPGDEAVKQEVELVPTQHKRLEQLPTTIGPELLLAPKPYRGDRVLFIDEGHDRTDDVYALLAADRARAESESRGRTEHRAQYNECKVFDSELLVREQ